MASRDSQPFHWHYTEFDDRNFEIHGRSLFFVIILFALIIVITLLFIYARWVCRFRHLSGGGPPTAVNSSSAPRLSAAPPPQGLDTATINGLPIFFHQSSAATTTSTVNETECCICLGVFQDGEKVRVLPECHHSYHCECVDRWLTTQSSCPLCRASLRADSHVDSVVPRIIIE